jgi:hypothetical protein
MQFTANGKILSSINPRKLLMIMKLSAILLILCLQVSASAVSQVTLMEKGASLEKVLQSIKQQSGLTLLYESDLMKRAKPVDVVVINVSVQQALEKAFEGQPLTFELINGKMIAVKAKDVKKKPEKTEIEIIAPVPPPITTITGRVTNESDQPLEGASVTVKGNKKGVATDMAGRFSLTNVDDNATLPARPATPAPRRPRRRRPGPRRLPRPSRP